MPVNQPGIANELAIPSPVAAFRGIRPGGDGIVSPCVHVLPGRFSGRDTGTGRIDRQACRRRLPKAAMAAWPGPAAGRRWARGRGESDRSPARSPVMKVARWQRHRASVPPSLPGGCKPFYIKHLNKTISPQKPKKDLTPLFFSFLRMDYVRGASFEARHCTGLSIFSHPHCVLTVAAFGLAEEEPGKVVLNKDARLKPSVLHLLHFLFQI